MATPIGSLVINLAANTAQLRNDLNRATGEVSRFVGVTGSLLRGLGASLAVGGITLLVQRTLDSVDALDKMATRVGVGVERLQELQFAARNTGVSTQDLDSALTKLNARIGAAVAGSKEAQDAFKRMGLDILNTNGSVREAGEQFTRIADKVRNAADATERARILNDAFGKGGQALAAMMIEGAAGIERMSAKARELGIILDASVIAEGNKAKDALSILSTVIGMNLARAILAASPLLVKMSEELVQTTKAAVDFWEALLNPSGESATAGALAKEIANLQRLKKELREIETGTGVGAMLNRFFGQDTNTRNAIKASEDAIAGYRQNLRDAVRERSEINAAARPKDRPPVTIAIDPGATRALEAFREKLLALQDAGDPVLQALSAIRAEANKLKEMGVAAKAVDALAAAMSRLVIDQAAQKAWTEYADAVIAETERVLATELAITDKIIAEEKRLTDEGVASWVAHADGIIGETERILAAELAMTDKVIADEKALTEQGIKDWVAYADAVIAETERALQAESAITDKVRAPRVALDQAMKNISNSVALLGAAFDPLPAQIKATETAMLAMADAVGVADPQVQRLRVTLEGLKQAQVVGTVIRESFDAVSRAITTAVTGVIQGTLTVKEAFANMGQSIVISLSERLITKGLDAIAEALATFVEELITSATAARAAAALVNAAMSSIGGGMGTADLGVNYYSASGGYYMATGGVVKARPGGTHVVVGEAGSDEMIVPLNRYTGGLASGGGGVTVIINNTVPNTEATARESSGADGQKQIEVLVAAAVESKAARGGLQSMFDAYGMKRRGRLR
jgi:hypothetical protein